MSLWLHAIVELTLLVLDLVGFRSLLLPVVISVLKMQLAIFAFTFLQQNYISIRVDCNT